jgi:hypothetical protein
MMCRIAASVANSCFHHENDHPRLQPTSRPFRQPVRPISADAKAASPLGQVQGGNIPSSPDHGIGGISSDQKRVSFGHRWEHTFSRVGSNEEVAGNMSVQSVWV